jgi:hypothetical protein
MSYHCGILSHDLGALAFIAKESSRFALRFINNCIGSRIDDDLRLVVI